jgi:hypothetical protein
LVGAVLIDQLNLGIADFIVGARSVFRDGHWRSTGTANGWLSNVVKEAPTLKE